MKKTIASLILSLLLAATASGETSVWLAETDSSALYIGGTIHFLRESDLPIPTEFDRAYDASEILVLETDIARVQSAEFQQALIANATYSDGQTLDQVISAEAYKKLEEYCTENNIPMANINQFKPWMLMIMFLGMELQKIGALQEGVDVYYYNKAMADNKTTGQLESIEDQLSILTSMGEGNESAFIIYSIDDLDKPDEIFDKLTTAWKTGDMASLSEIFFKDIKDKFPKLYKDIFVDRNTNWLSKIEEYLVTPETEFVLVGTGHLAGEDGVIARLKKLGYKVEKLK